MRICWCRNWQLTDLSFIPTLYWTRKKISVVDRRKPIPHLLLFFSQTRAVSDGQIRTVSDHELPKSREGAPWVRNVGHAWSKFQMRSLHFPTPLLHQLSWSWAQRVTESGTNSSRSSTTHGPLQTETPLALFCCYWGKLKSDSVVSSVCDSNQIVCELWFVCM